MRKNFIPRNDAFTCEKCGAKVEPAPSTFRNHCPACLTSKHVDDTLPGDRHSICLGSMPTIAYEGTDPNRLDLIQQCNICGQVRRNRTAPDDNKQLLFTDYQLLPVPPPPQPAK